MKRLGEILLERGSIAIAELHTGLEACHYSGGRLGTQLLKFGFVDEHALLEALSEQLEVPSVSATILRRAPDLYRRMIPLQVARRIQAIVFEKKDGNLGVAMTTPRNPAAIEEVVSYVGLDIKPHVATEVGILTALAEIKEQTEDDPPPPVAQGFVVASEEWQRLWTPHDLRSTDLLRPRGSKKAARLALASTFPALAPVPDGTGTSSTGVIDNDVFNRFLRDAEHRDDIGALLVRRAAAILDRCYVLAVHSGKIVGWLAKGSGVVVDDVQSFAASQDAPSILSEVNGGEVFNGHLPSGEVNDGLRELFGDPPPDEVVVYPVPVKNRVVAYLVGDKPGVGVSDSDRKHLRSVVEKAGIAFEILILKKKMVS